METESADACQWILFDSWQLTERNLFDAIFIFSQNKPAVLLQLQQLH